MIAFAQGAQSAIDIEVAPNGDLLYVDQAADAVRRIAWTRQRVQPGPDRRRARRHARRATPADGQLRPRRARATPTPATCSPTSGTSTATASSTTPPARARRTRSSRPGTYTVTLRVTDTSGASDTDAITIFAGGPAQPTTLTFSPLADARVDEATPDDELRHLDQAAGDRQRARAARATCGSTSPASTARSVSAKLRLTSTTDGTKDGPALFRAGDSWSESGLTWANRPAARRHSRWPTWARSPLGTVAEYDAQGARDRRRRRSTWRSCRPSATTSTSARGSTPTPRSGRSSWSPSTPPAHDTEPPTAPADRGGSRAEPRPRRPVLDAATDNVGVVRLRGAARRRSCIATLRRGDELHRHHGRSRDTRYEYTVRALDPSGNRSQRERPATRHHARRARHAGADGAHRASRAGRSGRGAWTSPGLPRPTTAA